jgi:hypothetical protein
VSDVIADWKQTADAVGIRAMLPKEWARALDDPGRDRVLRRRACGTRRRSPEPTYRGCWNSAGGRTR